MAFGAITVVEKSKSTMGPTRHDVISFVGNNSYLQSAGYATFFAAVMTALGIKQYSCLAVLPVDCQGYTLTYKSSDDSLHLWHGNNDGGADGPQVEVPDSANLSSVTFKVMVVSQ